MFKNPLFFLLMMITFITVFWYNANAEELNSMAIIDVEKIMNDSIASKEALKTITTKRDSFQSLITNKEKELKLQEEELTKETSLSQEELDKKRQNLRAEIAKFHKNLQKKRQQLELYNQIAQEQIYNKSLEIMKEVSNKNKIKLLLPSSTVIYSTNILDLTGDVLRKLNETFKQVDFAKIENLDKPIEDKVTKDAVKDKKE